MNYTVNSIDVAKLEEYKNCHAMLSQISIYVEEFCNDEDTTLMGVIRLLAEYHQLKAELFYNKLNKLKSAEEE
jgi:hypothetical protein